jgi:ribokinase
VRPHSICVAGSINVDLIAYLDTATDTARYAEGKAFGMSAGGKSLNTAMTIAALGPVQLVGRVGADDFGSFIARTLTTADITTTGLIIDGGAGTGIGHIRVSAEGEYDTVVIPGANGNFSPEDVDHILQDGEIPEYAVLNLEVPLRTSIHAARRFAASGSKVVLNLSPIQDGAKELLSLVDIVVLNREEAQLVLDQPNQHDPDVLLGALQEAGASAAVLTLGSEGAAYIDSEGHAGVVKGKPVPVVNSIGAGDTFLGAFVSALALGQSFKDALGFADAAGRIVCGKATSYLERIDCRDLEQIQPFHDHGWKLLP